MRIRPRSKYGSRKTTRGGIRYDSKLEADYADQLEWRKKAGEILKIERQVKVPIHVNGIFICNYVVDFRITLRDGRVQYVECKGVELPVWKLKIKLVAALYPDWDWVMVRKNR